MNNNYALWPICAAASKPAAASVINNIIILSPTHDDIMFTFRFITLHNAWVNNFYSLSHFLSLTPFLSLSLSFAVVSRRIRITHGVRNRKIPITSCTIGMHVSRAQLYNKQRYNNMAVTRVWAQYDIFWESVERLGCSCT